MSYRQQRRRLRAWQEGEMAGMWDFFRELTLGLAAAVRGVLFKC